LMDAATPPLTVALFMVLMGLGFGLVTQVLVVAVQNTVDRRELGTVTGAANFFRSLGGATGVAVFGAVLTGRLSYWLSRELPVGTGGRVEARSLVTTPARIRSLPVAVHEAVVRAFTHSLGDVFLVAAPIAAVGFVVVLFLKEQPLRKAPPPPPQPQPQPQPPGVLASQAERSQEGGA
jgi:MFS family permease